MWFLGPDDHTWSESITKFYRSVCMLNVPPTTNRSVSNSKTAAQVQSNQIHYYECFVCKDLEVESHGQLQSHIYSACCYSSRCVTYTNRQIIYVKPNTWFQASAAMLLRSALFWDITQRRVIILYRRFGTTYRSHLKGSRSPKWKENKEPSFLLRLLDPWRWDR